jgi:hypothetical protein
MNGVCGFKIRNGNSLRRRTLQHSCLVALLASRKEQNKEEKPLLLVLLPLFLLSQRNSHFCVSVPINSPTYHHVVTLFPVWRNDSTRTRHSPRDAPIMCFSFVVVSSLGGCGCVVDSSSSRRYPMEPAILEVLIVLRLY